MTTTIDRASPGSATQTRGYATVGPEAPLQPWSFERRAPRANDVRLEILYCGVCHSDIHMVRNEWGNSTYPLVPGHEIVGRVTAVGSAVKKFGVGDIVGVGCMVDSCRECSACRDGLEQYCEKTMTQTYGDKDRVTGAPTYGGYSESYVVREDFVLRIPPSLELGAVAPLLCAGITTYSPLRYAKVQAGQEVGVVGLGGLGHLAVKLAHAMGARVTMITTSPAKAEDARRLGADDVLISSDDAAMTARAKSFDFILDTIPTAHDLNPLVALLKRDARLTIVGALEPIEPGINGGPLAFNRVSVGGSLIGGIAETQEMLDFCAAHDVLPDVEMIRMDGIAEAFERMTKGDVRYRFVIDMASLKSDA